MAVLVVVQQIVQIIAVVCVKVDVLPCVMEVVRHLVYIYVMELAKVHVNIL